jgi:hypothetical protein
VPPVAVEPPMEFEESTPPLPPSPSSDSELETVHPTGTRQVATSAAVIEARTELLRVMATLSASARPVVIGLVA